MSITVMSMQPYALSPQDRAHGCALYGVGGLSTPESLSGPFTKFSVPSQIRPRFIGRTGILVTILTELSRPL